MKRRVLNFAESPDQIPNIFHFVYTGNEQERGQIKWTAVTVCRRGIRWPWRRFLYHNCNWRCSVRRIQVAPPTQGTRTGDSENYRQVKEDDGVCFAAFLFVQRHTLRVCTCSMSRLYNWSAHRTAIPKTFLFLCLYLNSCFLHLYFYILRIW